MRFAAVALFPFDAVQFVRQADFSAVGEGDAFHEVALRAFQSGVREFRGSLVW